MTVTDDRRATQPVDERVAQHTEDSVVAKVMAEASAAGVPCSRQTALCLIGVLRESLVELRRGVVHHHFTTHQMEVHAVLDVVVPDEQVLAPTGSAHAGLNTLLLVGNELSFVHTVEHRDGQYFCAARLELRTA